MTEVKSKDKTIKMLTFSGKSNNQYFNGEILPGAVDLQMIERNGTGTVSARYILKGTDCVLAPCNVYIENEGIININGEMETTPKIITDSEELAWLNHADLHCKFVTTENGEFYVKIYS